MGVLPLADCEDRALPLPASCQPPALPRPLPSDQAKVPGPGRLSQQHSCWEMLRFISTDIDSILSTWHELRARVILGKLVRGEEKKVAEGGGGETLSVTRSLRPTPARVPELPAVETPSSRRSRPGVRGGAHSGGGLQLA